MSLIKEETEVKKDIEWLKETLEERIDTMAKFEDVSYSIGLKEAYQHTLLLINQLDEPEVLSEDWIDENSYNVHLLGTPDVETVAVPREKLQNLLVPKREITEEQAWEVIHGKYGDEVLQNNIDYVESQGYVVIEKPVIPQFVADWFEEYKEDELIITAGTVIGNRRFPKDTKVAKWLNEDYVRNSEVFAQAWLAHPNIEVEEEQKYYVDLDTAAYVAKWDGDGSVQIYTDSISGSDEYELHLTEQEIKDYDERFWPFAVKVEELGE